jgi:voltage-gated potassium channel
MAQSPEEPSTIDWRRRLYAFIYRNDTGPGRAFDAVLLVAIVASVLVVLLDSVQAYHDRYGDLFLAAEWFFTVLFTLEYILRILSMHRPRHYILSPMGMIDLLAILPTYLAMFIAGGQTFAVIRALRLLRIFRVLKLAQYLNEANYLSEALKASRRKIIVFVSTVLTLVLIIGSMMYLVEGPENGFTSIPISMYWAIVTLTTVGYGDLAPQTTAGRVLASAVMILGYGIIAVPTGIVTAELVAAGHQVRSRRVCIGCGLIGHDTDALHCKKCGDTLVQSPLDNPP